MFNFKLNKKSNATNLKRKKTLFLILFSFFLTSSSILSSSLIINFIKNKKIKFLKNEINILNLELENLKNENKKLKSQIFSLQEVLNLTNAVNLNSNEEVTKLLSQFVNSTNNQIKIFDNDSLEYLKKYVDKLKKTTLNSINILLKKLFLIKENNTKNNYDNTLIVNQINLLENLKKNLINISFDNKENFKDSIYQINKITEHYHNLNSTFIERLNSVINEKNNLIKNIETKIQTTKDKLQNYVQKSIKTSEEMVETLNVIEKYLLSVIEKGVTFNDDNLNTEFLNNLNNLKIKINEYQKKIKQDIVKIKNSFENSKKIDDYSNLILLDTDIYAGKIKFYLQELNSYNFQFISIFLNYYKSSLTKIEELKNQVNNLDLEKENLNQKIIQSESEKTQAIVNLKKLKEDLTTSLLKSLENIIFSLQGISTTINNSTHQDKNLLVARLNKEILKLVDLKNEYTTDQFNSKYEISVEIAMKTANQVISEYKNNILDPLKKEYQKTKIQLENLEIKLTESKEILTLKSTQLSNVSKELQVTRNNLQSKENELSIILDKLKESKNNLDQLNLDKKNSLNNLNKTILDLEKRYLNLKELAVKLIEFAKDKKIDTNKLEQLIIYVFSTKNTENFQIMNQVLNEYIDKYNEFFSELLLVYSKLLTKKDQQSKLLIEKNDLLIESSKLVEIQKIDLENKINSLEKELKESQKTINELKNKKIIQNNLQINSSVIKNFNKTTSWSQEIISGYKFSENKKVKIEAKETFNIVNDNDITIQYYDNTSKTNKQIILTKTNNYSSKIYLPYYIFSPFILQSEIWHDNGDALYGYGGAEKEITKYSNKVIENESFVETKFENNVLTIYIKSEITLQKDKIIENYIGESKYSSTDTYNKYLLYSGTLKSPITILGIS
ncbi:coiled-coil domain-containing protein [Mycoplasmopsis cricetuli]|uniref:hypothetical protein n=1 Tax=Mycoplasmopsis cricetuli TaxID=171283 RepID=UPI00046F6FE4|nr:hypothetical protein [Mycoplasmopsis cricetuli]